jgi:hypothetical protein
MNRNKIEISIQEKMEQAGTETLASIPVFIQSKCSVEDLPILPLRHTRYDNLSLIYCELSPPAIKKIATNGSIQFIWDAQTPIHIVPAAHQQAAQRTDIRKLIFDPGHQDHPEYGPNVKGRGIRCAVIDTAADTAHSDIVANVRKTKDCTDDNNFFSGSQYHGTHVAGIIAQIAPDVELYLYKVFDANMLATRKFIVDAILAAVADGVHIINGSWGEASCSGGCPVELAAKYAVEQGVIFCSSAGNAGPDAASLSCPAGSESVLTIGSSNCDKEISDFSSRGPSYHSGIEKPDIIAPGENIASCCPGGGYITFSGTSMAAPATAGGCALLLSHMCGHDHIKDKTVQKSIKEILVESALDLGHHHHTQGAGFIDINSSILRSDTSGWALIEQRLERFCRAYWLPIALSICLFFGLWLTKPWVIMESQLIENAVAFTVTEPVLPPKRPPLNGKYEPNITKRENVQKIPVVEESPTEMHDKPHYSKEAHYSITVEFYRTLEILEKLMEEAF